MTEETKVDPLIVPEFNGQLVTINGLTYGIMNTIDVMMPSKQDMQGLEVVGLVLKLYSGIDAEFEYSDCHFCGTPTDQYGYESRKGELKVAEGDRLGMDWFYHDEPLRRHWLGDCRPDLVEHEIGQLCTWPEFIKEEELHLNKPMNRPGCYAYQDHETGKWTDQHIHFYPKDAR